MAPIAASLLTPRDAADHYVSQDEASRAYQRFSQGDEGDGRAPYEELKNVFEARLQEYKEHALDLRLNLFYQLLFIAISISIMVSSAPTFKIPLIEQPLPAQWVHAALPPSLMWLWIWFGFLFNEVINNRLALWRLGEALEGPIEELKLAHPVIWSQYVFTYSYRPLVRDGGLLDGWFLVFRKSFIESNEGMPGLMQFFAVGFGFLLGLSHGCVLGVIWHGCRRFWNQPVGRFWCGVCFWAAVVIFGLTHFTFYYYGGHWNWVHPIVVGTCIAFIFVVSGIPQESLKWWKRRMAALGEEVRAAQQE